MTQRPIISIFKKPADLPPERQNNIASFPDLASALSALAELGSRWKWASIRQGGSK
jgi:hypothetical protein